MPRCSANAVRLSFFKEAVRCSTLTPPCPRQGVRHVAELLEGLGYTQHYEAAKRAGQKSTVKRQMANVKSHGILPFDPALRDDLHFDLPFDVS